MTGLSLPHGILIYGPSGTGKTQLAKAVAHDIGIHVETVAGPELWSKLVFTVPSLSKNTVNQNTFLDFFFFFKCNFCELPIAGDFYTQATK